MKEVDRVDRDSWVDGFRYAMAMYSPPVPMRGYAERLFDEYFGVKTVTESFVDLDENGERVQIPIPTGWDVTVKALGWEAWAHTPDGASGVAVEGQTKGEALRNLKTRMEDWLKNA